MSSYYDSDRGVHFFKRIEEDALRNGDLRIPRCFVMKYWGEISNPLFLLLPKGVKWKVNWKRIGVEVWLINEWKKFAEFYSLDQDYLLMFKYVGMSQFEVVILDQSGLEMVYPLMEAALDGADNDNSLPQRKMAKSPFTKKMKNNPRKEPNSYYSSQDVETTCAQSQRIKDELKEFYEDDSDNEKSKKTDRTRKMSANMISSNSKDKSIQSEELLEDTKSSTALERAHNFRSENPFFIRVMYPSYIQRSSMAMPASFITKDEQKDEESITLWISEERTWHVKFYRNNSNGQIILSTGWVDFARDNNLKVGNVCVFEKMKELGISFRVFIYRDTEESSPLKFPEASEILNITIENHFTVCIKPTKLHAMNISRVFFKHHGIVNTKEVVLQFGGRSWNVKLDPYCRLTSGWSEFLNQCKLKVGDVCHFELIDKNKVVFKVSTVECID